MFKATLRMFTDLGLPSHFCIEYPTLCRWVLTVRRNYRSAAHVPYHNWYHGFNVAQMMFAMLRTTGWDKQFGMVRQIMEISFLLPCN